MSDVNSSKIAERLRFLLRAQHGNELENLEGAARHLDVDELSLRVSIREGEPEPALHVLLAFVRVFGVDPAWLITGEYSGSAHRTAIDADAVSIRRTIERMLTPSDPLSPS